MDQPQPNAPTLAADLAVAQALVQQLREEKVRLEEELNLAKDLQLGMLPPNQPLLPEELGVELYAKLIPAREVGGDFYDYYWLDEDHLTIVMGDVSGKGVAAGFMMAICKALLKSRAASERSPASIVTHVNDQLAVHNPNHMFVTLFVAVINCRTRELRYTNAGHNPTFIRRKTGDLLKLSDLHGPVVAAMGGLMYKETTVALEAGDVVFAYTDGITEAHNSAQELFSETRLVEALSQPFKTPKELVERLFMNILLFERGEEQFDDITALCLALKTVS